MTSKELYSTCGIQRFDTVSNVYSVNTLSEAPQARAGGGTRLAPCLARFSRLFFRCGSISLVLNYNSPIFEILLGAKYPFLCIFRLPCRSLEPTIVPLICINKQRLFLKSSTERNEPIFHRPSSQC